MSLGAPILDVSVAVSTSGGTAVEIPTVANM